MAESQGQIFLLQVKNPADGSTVTFVTPRPPSEASASGLRPEAVMGRLKGAQEQLTAENFEENPIFLEFVHWVIGKHCQNWPGLQEEATRQQDGFVYIIDARCGRPDGDPPQEDILGVVKIEKGEIVGFQGSPNYRMLTERGFMQLSPWLREKWLEELEALPPLEPPEES